ncbi:helical backbone metal receptor [Turicibacter sanguinis]|uniref:ABC transporter substrate-binding protein n=2 Tax=Turicibacter sanguinis TaxID=154288 RepID=A0A6I3NCB1_9FIRM|nr:helical backbone metal receptor [Turicibacter sanguinis]EFF64705.1 putative heme ABC transporter, heme-binding protein IsdE [Turicibacter sanguinis PC909]MCU7189958.1 helical backbone metal receptor [Turicibacter sanguinis]MCU7211450.1 helical backbone metal receptor [Turicibacter sanguinis]MTK20069.1 ABC transporter substrate-binding protein [Turicibacter sanguinis]MTK69177.1 ABC transporter substrate-binding protein [Turicibacter sanguinis]
MKFKHLLSMILVSTTLLVGCQSSKGTEVEEQIPVVDETSSSTKQEEETTDVEKEVEEIKVVAATVSATQVLAELNAEVLGVPATSQTLPDGYQDLPQVGQAMNPDLEIVASLNPDLFIMDASFKSSVEESLTEYGLNTFFFETGTYTAFLNSIKELGNAINRQDEATTLLNQLKQAEEVALANKTEQAPTVAIIFGAGDNFMLATESSYLGDLAKTLGAINIASEIDTNIESAYIQFSLEQILAQNPDYVLRFAHGNIEETSKMFDEAFDKNEAYQQLDAVADGKVYDLDSTIFNVSANLKVTEAITKLGEILYGN